KNKKQKWKVVHSLQLAGADIVVFNDNDVAGYAHAEATCQCSLGACRRVRRLDLKLHWPDMPEGADVSDWLALPGNSREKLDALMEMAPDYGKQEPLLPPLPFRRHGEKEPLDDRAWLVDHLIPQVGTGVLAGQLGTLQTFVA